MDILVKFILKQPKKLLAKKIERSVIINDTHIFYYFENVTTPYDMNYVYSNLHDNQIIKTCIQKIVKSCDSSKEILYWDIIDIQISYDDLDKFRDIMKNVAKKHESMITSTLNIN